MRTYWRILKYIKPYWPQLTGSILCVLFFVVFSSVSLFSIMPFLSTIFSAETQTIQTPGNAAQETGIPSEGNATQETASPSTDRTGQDTTVRSPETGTPKILPGIPIQDRFNLKSKAYDLFLGKNFRQNRQQALQRLCIMLVVVILLQSVFGYFQAYLMGYVEQGVIRDLRNAITAHIHTLSLSYFHKTRTGQLISRITNDVTLVNGGLSASFFTMVKNPLLIMASLGIAFYISWQLTLVAFLILPFSLILISWIGLSLRKYSAISQERIADLTSVLHESIAGTRIVKAFGMELFEIGRFKEHSHRYFRTLLRLTRLRNLASPVTEFLGTAVGVGLLWFGGREVLKGNVLKPEEFIMFLFVIFSIMQPVKEIASVNNRIQEALAAGERIFAVLDTQPDVVEVPDARPVKSFSDRVVFSHVSFAYHGSDWVLRDIGFSVRKGELLAIVGPSGAGKSTLVDLIPRFYDPQEGSIALDKTDIRQFRLRDLRALLGIVTQETILFNDSVRNNIAYGLAHVPQHRVEEAARAANAHAFIQRMEKGYDTVIGERGVKLSGGERQRLAIARALLKDPPILILDEATSSLDTESELLVQEAVDRLMENRTSFVIAHRLSTILHADKIVVLDRGRIVEEGTHRQLLGRKGLYKKLYDMQFRDQSVIRG